jgi:hypothetical protein
MNLPGLRMSRGIQRTLSKDLCQVPGLRITRMMVCNGVSYHNQFYEIEAKATPHSDDGTEYAEIEVEVEETHEPEDEDEDEEEPGAVHSKLQTVTPAGPFH